MGGDFDARLKRNTVATRTSKSDGRELTLSNPLAVVEARFSYKVLDRLYFPNFIAIERTVDGSTRYVVYEVVGVTPTHYQLSGVDSSMPTILRNEYLDTIKESWGKSQETWIDLLAIPTSYVAKVEGSTLEFSRAPHTPLPGAKAMLLSKEAVERFLCEAGGERIGNMIGFDLPFTVSMDNLIRFHCGFFGFTGSGKSNLTSALVRRALKLDPSLTLVVLDIAGEYVVNLLDLLDRDAKVVSTESFDSEDEFVSAQAIPESLEDVAGRGAIEEALSKVYARGVEKLSLQQEGGIDMGWIQQLLQGTVDNARAGATAAKVGLTKLAMAFYEKRGYRQSTRLTELDDDARKELALTLKDINSKVNERSGLRSDLDMIIEMLESGDFGTSATASLTPEKLAEQLARGTAARLNVLYLPDPIHARIVAERLIKRLLFLKKKVGNMQRVLVVLDEAQ